MTPDTCGPTWLVPLAYYDPDECCWRMSGVIFPSDWPTSSQTCPAWGMTRGGELFELPTPALPTAEPESSSLLPTPNASVSQDGETFATWEVRRQVALTKGYNGNGIGMPLTIAVQLLPTPVTEPSTGNGHARDLGKEIKLLPTPVADHSRGLPQPGTDYQSLPNAVMDLLPTPGCAGGGKKIPEDAVWSGKAAYKPTGEKVQVHIDQIARLLPTPTVGDPKSAANSTAGRSEGSQHHSGTTLTDWSRGATTNPPSVAGSASLDDQPPDLLSLLAAEND